ELADAVSVPVFASSLLQLPMVHRMLISRQKVGLLVARRAALTPSHLAAIGAESVPISVVGLDGSSEFREVMMEGRRTELDVVRLREQVLAAVEPLAAEPELGAVVIECTDVVPFAQDIQRRLGVPVFDIVTLTNYVYG